MLLSDSAVPCISHHLWHFTQYLVPNTVHTGEERQCLCHRLLQKFCIFLRGKNWVKSAGDQRQNCSDHCHNQKKVWGCHTSGTEKILLDHKKVKLPIKFLLIYHNIDITPYLSPTTQPLKGKQCQLYKIFSRIKHHFLPWHFHFWLESCKSLNCSNSKQEFYLVMVTVLLFSKNYCF